MFSTLFVQRVNDNVFMNFCNSPCSKVLYSLNFGFSSLQLCFPEVLIIELDIFPLFVPIAVEDPVNLTSHNV